MNSVRVSVSLSHRPEGSGNHSLLSSPSFPFITLTLWPRPRHAFRLCNYAFRHGAVFALPPRSHIVSLSLLSPISALNPPRDHQREKRTIGFGPNHHRAGDIKWTDQRQCHCTLSSSASPPDRHYYRNKGASAGQGRARGRAAPHGQETSKIGLNDGRRPRPRRRSRPVRRCGLVVGPSESPRQIDFCLGQETAAVEGREEGENDQAMQPPARPNDQPRRH